MGISTPGDLQRFAAHRPPNLPSLPPWVVNLCSCSAKPVCFEPNDVFITADWTVRAASEATSSWDKHFVNDTAPHVPCCELVDDSADMLGL
eukprot:6198239-Pleurochrysis_carterae.AAC.2